MTADHTAATDQQFADLLARVEAAEEAEEGLRARLADELGRHADTMSRQWDDERAWVGCRCGHERGTFTPAEMAADLPGLLRAHRLHVADAALAVIRTRADAGEQR